MYGEDHYTIDYNWPDGVDTIKGRLERSGDEFTKKSPNNKTLKF